MVKNLPTMQETWVRSLGQEDTLEKGMATHPRILAWRIPWKEEPGGLQCTGCKESDTTEYKHKQAQYMCGSPVLKEKRNLRPELRRLEGGRGHQHIPKGNILRFL